MKRSFLERTQIWLVISDESNTIVITSTPIGQNFRIRIAIEFYLFRNRRSEVWQIEMNREISRTMLKKSVKKLTLRIRTSRGQRLHCSPISYPGVGRNERMLGERRIVWSWLWLVSVSTGGGICARHIALPEQAYVYVQIYCQRWVLGYWLML